jgi:hypothetical protein
MKKLLPLSLLLVLSLAFNACKKDKDPTPAPTKTDFLTAKPWKNTGLTVSPRLPADTTGTNFLPEDIFTYRQNNGGGCRNDDLKKFNKNPATYSLEEGATKCNPADSQVYETGTWVFSSDENTLVLTEAGYPPVNYTIIELSATTLKYQYQFQARTNSTSPIVTYTVTETLSNQ